MRPHPRTHRCHSTAASKTPLSSPRHLEVFLMANRELVASFRACNRRLPPQAQHCTQKNPISRSRLSGLNQYPTGFTTLTLIHPPSSSYSNSKLPFSLYGPIASFQAGSPPSPTSSSLAQSASASSHPSSPSWLSVSYSRAAASVATP